MRFVSCRPQSSDVLYRFFDDDLLSKLSAENTCSFALDIIEDKDQYILKADLPGIKKEDIKVSLEDNILMVKAERKSETESQDRQIHRIERSFGQYQRSLNLGANVDAGKIRANYKDGVLELTVPKAQEVKPKAVEVQIE